LVHCLRLRCQPEQVDELSAELWERGTIGIGETEDAGQVWLLAGFDDDSNKNELIALFAAYLPSWSTAPEVDWVRATQEAWPAQNIGSRIFLVPKWSESPTPEGRIRIVHNPGLACGTGRHPCSQLAVMELEKHVQPGATVVDVGTGSGILAIAALRLGAARVIGVDVDPSVMEVAKENLTLNDLRATLVCGSADCIRANAADLTVANISGTVLLWLADDLIRITRPGGWLILTGFEQNESEVVGRAFSAGDVTELEGWSCISVRVS
jgi:ribosomal protein L11 methyltransferase